MKVSWDMLGYWLAVAGIPSDVDEDVTADYEFDPWRPAPDTECVRVTLSMEGAERLATLVASKMRGVGP